MGMPLWAETASESAIDAGPEIIFTFTSSRFSNADSGFKYYPQTRPTIYTRLVNNQPSVQIIFFETSTKRSKNQSFWGKDNQNATHKVAQKERTQKLGS
jgi:hypothetical protein